MQVFLENIGKKYDKNYIFRGLTFEFNTPSSYLIKGANGSGKTTLLQIIAGSVSPTEGHVAYKDSGKLLIPSVIFRHVAIAAPYLELPGEMTLSELIAFHFRFKKTVMGMPNDGILSLAGFEKEADKCLSFFSSGMLQKLKLSLALLSDSKMILLDEPYTCLDGSAIEWFKNLLQEYIKDRLLIICANDSDVRPYDYCSEKISVETYKIL